MDQYPANIVILCSAFVYDSFYLLVYLCLQTPAESWGFYYPGEWINLEKDGLSGTLSVWENTSAEKRCVVHSHAFPAYEE